MIRTYVATDARNRRVESLLVMCAQLYRSPRVETIGWLPTKHCCVMQRLRRPVPNTSLVTTLATDRQTEDVAIA